ncbi:MAG: Nif3-like dinuclear metal center hexameric protein [Bacteroidaceae bacterium]|nr:Nif3-like dinuclear metal center hexameric protein [Bacteroidaceae bacterium]
MNIKEVLRALETFAPLPLQEGYDNAGLQIGLTGEQDVTGALLCLDVTEAVVEEAINSGFNLIVSHHPLLFHGLKRIDEGGSSVERLVIKLIRNNIAVVSMHTNLDNVDGGVNHKIAEKLGLTDVCFLQPMSRGGHCGGSGIIGTLRGMATIKDAVNHIQKTFSTNHPSMSNIPQHLYTKNTAGGLRIAVCGGAGSFLLGDAKEQGADIFITGEMHYHEYFEALDSILIMVLGHYETEQFTSELLKEILAKGCPTLPTKLFGSTNPIVH